MGVNWVDLILVVLVVLVVGLEIKRGFSKALFDFATILAALFIVSMIHPKVASSFQFLADKQTNEAFTYFMMVVLIGAGCWYIGKVAYDSMLFTLEPFEQAMGAVCGLGLAVIVGHACTKTLAIIGTVNGKLPEVLTQSTLGMEFYKFKTYHSVITLLAKLAE